jgi:hypothetical protein
MDAATVESLAPHVDVNGRGYSGMTLLMWLSGSAPKPDPNPL